MACKLRGGRHDPRHPLESGMKEKSQIRRQQVPKKYSRSKEFRPRAAHNIATATAHSRETLHGMPKHLRLSGPCEEKYWQWRGGLSHRNGAVRTKKQSNTTSTGQKRYEVCSHNSTQQHYMSWLSCVQERMHEYSSSSGIDSRTILGGSKQDHLHLFIGGTTWRSVKHV